jgi:uncharacterized protein
MPAPGRARPGPASAAPPASPGRDKASASPAAIAARQRIDGLDVLRGLALFGVLAVNLVSEFRVSIFAQFLPQPQAPHLLERLVLALVHDGLELKAFALFSFLFGVGLAMQFERLAGTGRPLYWLARRLLVLLGFGLLHLLLIWNGDILTEYACAGLLVLPLLHATRRQLGLAALVLLGLYVALPALPVRLPFPEPAWIAHHVVQANVVYRTGTWLEVTRFSLGELPALLGLHLLILPRTLGLFVLGTLAWRSGILSRPADHQARLFVCGGACGAIGVAIDVANAATGNAGVLANLAPVGLALAFGAGVLGAAARPPALALLRPFAAIGRMAFTNYLGQSLLFGWVFFGYGLGQFGHWPAAPVFACGVGVYLVQLRLSQLWLRRCRFGPLEWCWRTLMYGRRQPMRR